MAKGQLTQAKRNKIEELVLSTLKILDNKKMLNYERYKAMFDVMDDKAFEKWANSMGHELDDTIQMYQLPFEEMTLKQIEAAAKHINVPLEEYVWYYHNDKEGIRTKMRVPVGLYGSI